MLMFYLLNEEERTISKESIVSIIIPLILRVPFHNFSSLEEGYVFFINIWFESVASG